MGNHPKQEGTRAEGGKETEKTNGEGCEEGERSQEEHVRGLQNLVRRWSPEPLGRAQYLIKMEWIQYARSPT